MKTMAEFHFSPRPNRAAEIDWMPWGPDAFARAAREDKPILLGISAVWCHWCHVMDETTYSDGDVISLVNDDYVAVRVDNDERPDVNSRYNMGGWPTTAFLAPDGTTLTGATYLPPKQMRQALSDIARFYREKKDEILARSQEMQGRKITFEASRPEALSEAIVDRVRGVIADAYDPEYGGFGDAPKFPQPEVLEFLLYEWRARNDRTCYDMVARTMLEMSRGGMYDHVEGGFFRYSTTRDWSVPHFEKMAEDHAGLLRVLSQLQLWAPTQAVHETLRSALTYVRTVLRNPVTGFFSGSQDADEAYFALPLEERRKDKAPFVDPRSYSNWTAGLAGAFAWAGLATDDDDLTREALVTLDALHERMRDPDGLLYHVVAPGEEPRIRGLLTDQVAYVRALLDAHEATGEARLLERARLHTDAIAQYFGAPDGGFYDHARREDVIGRLDLADRPMIENGTMAENLLRLGVMTGEDRYRETAERILTLYAASYENAGSFGATYARALRRYLTRPVSVRVRGTPEATSDLREAARRLPAAFTTVYGEVGDGTPQAYVCAGTTCAAPVTSAADLREAYESVVPA